MTVWFSTCYTGGFSSVNLSVFELLEKYTQHSFFENMVLWISFLDNNYILLLVQVSLIILSVFGVWHEIKDLWPPFGLFHFNIMLWDLYGTVSLFSLNFLFIICRFKNSLYIFGIIGFLWFLPPTFKEWTGQWWGSPTPFLWNSNTNLWPYFYTTQRTKKNY